VYSATGFCITSVALAMFLKQTTQKHSDCFCFPAFVEIPADAVFYTLQIKKKATNPCNKMTIINDD